MLITSRLLLREYKKEDAGELYSIFSDERTMGFWPEPFTREQTEAWVEQQLTHYETYGYSRRLVVLQETGEVIGDCGIVKRMIDGEEENDLGYIIHAPFWNQGYGFEAAQASLDEGLYSLDLSRICANMPHDHTSSRRVAEKLGMNREKVFQNKRNRDIMTYLYSVENN